VDDPLPDLPIALPARPRPRTAARLVSQRRVGRWAHQRAATGRDLRHHGPTGHSRLPILLATDGPGNTPGDLIFQQPLTSRIELRNRSRLAYELDLQMGVQFKIWRSLTATMGLRELIYADVAADIKRGAPAAQPSGTANFETVSEVDRSVGYEGYFLGVSYRF
jgi:hypothetical protein